MHKMLMLKASFTSAIQRGQAQWSLYESTSSHLIRCPFLGETSASNPAHTSSRVFLIIHSAMFHIIKQGLYVGWRAIEDCLFGSGQKKGCVTFKMLRTTAMTIKTSHVWGFVWGPEALLICIILGEVCGFRQPYETSSVCFCIYLHNLTISLFVQ